MSNHVDGKVIITGAAGSFGYVVSPKLAASGARAIASDVNEAELRVTHDCVIAEGGRIESVVALEATIDHTLQARDRLVEALGTAIEEASQ